MSRPATVILITLSLLSGCSILAPQTDRSRFYVLTPSIDAPAPAGGSGGLLLGIGPVRFPDYLDRSQIVTRVAPNQMVFSDDDRWAEPLARNFSRILGENIARLVNTERIVTLPTFVPVTVEYEVPLEVLRFESDDKGVVELAVRWGVRTTAPGKILYATESRIVETAPETKTRAIVQAMSNAAGKLSQEIAAELQRLSATRGKP